MMWAEVRTVNCGATTNVSARLCGQPLLLTIITIHVTYALRFFTLEHGKRILTSKTFVTK